MEWQILVSNSPLNSKGYTIHKNAKIHCFNEKGNALCSKNMFMFPGFFHTTDLGENDIESRPECFCKKCVSIYKKNVKAN